MSGPQAGQREPDDERGPKPPPGRAGAGASQAPDALGSRPAPRPTVLPAVPGRPSRPEKSTEVPETETVRGRQKDKDGGH